MTLGLADILFFMLPYRVCVQKLYVKNATVRHGVAVEPTLNKFWVIFHKTKGASVIVALRQKSNANLGGLANIDY